MIGDGRGGYPDGGDIKTVETTARGGDTFKQRCEWCDKQIVRRGTGGELTVLAESGSGRWRATPTRKHSACWRRAKARKSPKASTAK